MTFNDLFGSGKPLIGVLHLLPLPGAPLYGGNIQRVYDQALSELDVFRQHRLDSVIVENFRDMPYYPGRVPAETVAALAAISRDIVKAAQMPVGINVLRSDGEAAVWLQALDLVPDVAAPPLPASRPDGAAATPSAPRR